jgi:hypothetical protein
LRLSLSQTDERRRLKEHEGMLCFPEMGYPTKTTDAGAGRPLGLPVELSYGRAGSLSRAVGHRQLALQTGPMLDTSFVDTRQAA